MKRTGRKREWSIALFCAGLLFFFPPILSIFDKPVLVFGLPLAYIVLYGFWALVIIAIAYGARRGPVVRDNSVSRIPPSKYKDLP